MKGKIMKWTMIGSAIVLVSVLGFGASKLFMNSKVAVDTTNTGEVIEVAENNQPVTTDSENVDTSNNEVPAVEINTDAAEVIESDKETGSQTVVNTDGDVVVTGDEALVEAEGNDEAQAILDNIISDMEERNEEMFGEGTSTDDKVYEADIKDVKSEDDLKEAYNPETVTASSKDNDVEIDEATKELFATMGWGEPTTDHSGGDVIPEGVSIDDIETSVQEYKGEGNPFHTP